MSGIAVFIIFIVALAISSLQNSSLKNEIDNNIVYAQQERLILPQQQQTETLQQQNATLLGVKIVSPVRGESIQIEKDLKIEGQSTDNSVSECDVSVIVNSIWPYQQANPTGRGGSNDYSSWEFLLTQNHTIIKEGINEITAKLSCLPPSPSSADGLTSKNISKWYSINVTGIASSTSSISTTIANDSKLPPLIHQPSSPTTSLQTNTLEEPIGNSQNNSISPGVNVLESSAEVESQIPEQTEGTPSGNGEIDSGNGDDIVQGDNNDNRISGGNGDDIIYGNGGDDILSGDNGDDMLYGELGDDKLTGNNGDDILSSGSGNDILSGENGSDTFDCGEGNDMVMDHEDSDIVNQNCENY